MKRSACGRYLPTLVFSVVVAALPGRADDSAEVFVTIGQREAARIQAALERRRLDDVLLVESEGEIVVARIREDRIPLLAHFVHTELRRCGGFVAHESREAAFQAVAQERDLVSAEPLIEYTIDNGPVVQALLPNIQEANIRSTINALAAFFTRYHSSQTGQDSASWIRNQWLGFAQGRSDVTVELFAHPAAVTPQPSVILTIQGTTLANEIVVLGAHQDSINGASGRAPGADDDASGVASLSEVIRVALSMGYRPQRTVKFMAYAAEEVGLRGSNDIARQYRNANVNVVGVFHLDMTNYKGTPASDIVMITERTNAAQNTFVGQLVDTYLGLPRTTTQCGYACSDHASWNSQGYAASFPFEAAFGQHNMSIHTSNDTLAQSGNNANHALKFAKLATAYLAEIAKGDFPGNNQPPIAKAGPDQNVTVGSVVTLNGSGSSDPDNGPGPLSFGWRQVSGPSVTLSNPNIAQPTFTPAAAATYVFELTVNDGAASVSDQVQVVATGGGAGGQTAVFDAALKAPKCATVGNSCDSGPALLLGRAGLGAEPNQPNTVNSSCVDGTSGTFHADESSDRIRVFTPDGTNFAAGKTVTIQATVWAWTTPSSDRADFFYAPDATNPVWTLIGTLAPTAAGAQTLSVNYTLPSGAMQAVRVQYRYQSANTACAAGAYNDRDDLAFAVTSAPITSVFFDNFETAMGWTTNPNGTDNATAGRWERGDPEATTSSGAKQLGTTASGVNDLVTARLAGASQGDNDVDGGVTSIQSPPVTLPSSGNLTLTFQYYLAHGSNSSSADFFRAVVVGSTTTQVFQSLGATTNRDGAWTTATASLNAFAGQTVRIRFEAADASAASLVEAGVDDVRVVRQ